MSRRRRVHVPGGIYYVRIRVRRNQRLVEELEDVRALNQLLAATLKKCRARLHTFHWGEKTGYLVLEVSHVPLGVLIATFTGRYTRCVRARREQRGRLFRRYEAVLLARMSELKLVVRHIHWRRARSRLACECPLHHLNGHYAYMRDGVQPWVTSDLIMSGLADGVRASDGKRKRVLYARWMERPESSSERERLHRMMRNANARAAAKASQVAKLRAQPGRNLATVLQPIICAVAQKLGVSPDDVVAGSRKRDCSLARSLIAWHAVQRGDAGYADIARYMGVNRSTISRRVDRHREQEAELFDTPLGLDKDKAG